MRMQTALRTLTLLCTLSLPLTALAGSLDTTRTPATGSGMPTTADLYNQLVNGATKSVPASFQEPVAGPTAGTGKSLADIQGLLPAPDVVNGAKVEEVLVGKSFWGLRTDGTWGGGKSGAMPNNGAVTIIPGTSAQPIVAGYHNGSGTVGGDANLGSCGIKPGMTLFGITGKPLPAATGQTISYEAGDDGAYQKGCTPINNNWGGPGGGGYNRTNLGWSSANGSGFIDNSNNTVTDTVSRLIWTKNANLPGASKTWSEALAYVAAMNSGANTNFGFTDWRLPNINELRSLIDPDRSSPSLPASHPFSSVQYSPATRYWSSTTLYYNSSSAGIAKMDSGYVTYDPKTRYSGANYYVWPVRSGQ